MTTLPMEETKTSNTLDVIAAIALVVAALFGGLSLLFLFIAGLFTHGWVTLFTTVAFAVLLGSWAGARLHKNGKMAQYIESIQDNY